MPLPLPSSVSSFARNMTRPLSRDKADTLLLLGTCVLVLAPHAGHLPAWVILACPAILLWRGWLTFHGKRMPPRWVLLPVALLAMGGVYATHKTLLGREAGVSMLVLLLTLKLLEMHAKRDLFVVLFLSFFLVLANFFYSQTIGVALLTITAVVAILTTQVSFQYTGVVPPLRKRLRLGASILALAAPLTLVLFVLFPRIEGPLWGMPSDAHTARSGMSDTMAPGNISSLALSDEIAFRARFIDPAPPKSKLYWRSGVLGIYDGRTWYPMRSRTQLSSAIVIRPRGAPVRYQVTLEPTRRRWLFALDIPQAVPRLAGNMATVGPEVQLMAAEPINERIRYDAASYLDFDLQPNERALVLQQWLELPSGYNPRTLEYAASLRQQFGEQFGNQPGKNAEIVNAVLRFFRQENFSYTLEPPALGRHVVDEFLFDTRAGFCEHYSGAFVVLMRAMGIPARVVIGYQGGEINPADDFMTVRQSDAHAWAEVWLENRGWIRVDPTAAVAPDRVERNLSSVIPRQTFGGLIGLDVSQYSWLAKLGSLRHSWEAVNNAWNQWVLNYTPERQKSFIESLGFDRVDWRVLTALMFAVGSAVMAIVALPLLMNRSKLDPADALYQSLCKQMERHGLHRSIHEGPRSYGMRLTATESPLTSEKKAAVARFVHIYETARYGIEGNASKAAVISQLKSLLAVCR